MTPQQILEKVQNLPIDIIAKGDFLIAIELDAMDVSPGGIALPARDPSASNRALVVSVGPGRRNTMEGDLIPVDIEVGDTIVIGKRIATYVEIYLMKFITLREHDVIAVIRQKPPEELPDNSGEEIPAEAA